MNTLKPLIKKMKSAKVIDTSLLDETANALLQLDFQQISIKYVLSEIFSDQKAAIMAAEDDTAAISSIFSAFQAINPNETFQQYCARIDTCNATINTYKSQCIKLRATITQLLNKVNLLDDTLFPTAVPKNIFLGKLKALHALYLATDKPGVTPQNNYLAFLAALEAKAESTKIETMRAIGEARQDEKKSYTIVVRNWYRPGARGRTVAGVETGGHISIELIPADPKQSLYFSFYPNANTDNRPNSAFNHVASFLRLPKNTDFSGYFESLAIELYQTSEHCPAQQKYESLDTVVINCLTIPQAFENAYQVATELMTTPQTYNFYQNNCAIMAMRVLKAASSQMDSTVPTPTITTPLTLLAYCNAIKEELKAQANTRLFNAISSEQATRTFLIKIIEEYKNTDESSIDDFFEEAEQDYFIGQSPESILDNNSDSCSSHMPDQSNEEKNISINAVLETLQYFIYLSYYKTPEQIQSDISCYIKPRIRYLEEKIGNQQLVENKLFIFLNMLKKIETYFSSSETRMKFTVSLLKVNLTNAAESLFSAQNLQSRFPDFQQLNTINTYCEKDLHNQTLSITKNTFRMPKDEQINNIIRAYNYSLSESDDISLNENQRLYRFALRLQSSIAYINESPPTNMTAAENQFYNVAKNNLISALGQAQSSLYLSRNSLVFNALGKAFNIAVSEDVTDLTSEKSKINNKLLENEVLTFLHKHAQHIKPASCPNQVNKNFSARLNDSELIHLSKPTWWKFWRWGERHNLFLLESKTWAAQIFNNSEKNLAYKQQRLNDLIKDRIPSKIQFWRRAERAEYKNLLQETQFRLLVDGFSKGELTAKEFAGKSLSIAKKHTYLSGKIYNVVQTVQNIHSSHAEVFDKAVLTSIQALEKNGNQGEVQLSNPISRKRTPAVPDVPTHDVRTSGKTLPLERTMRPRKTPGMGMFANNSHPAIPPILFLGRPSDFRPS